VAAVGIEPALAGTDFDGVTTWTIAKYDVPRSVERKLPATWTSCNVNQRAAITENLLQVKRREVIQVTRPTLVTRRSTSSRVVADVRIGVLRCPRTGVAPGSPDI